MNYKKNRFINFFKKNKDSKDGEFSKEARNLLIGKVIARGEYKSKYGKVDENFKAEHFKKDSETNQIGFTIK